MHSMYFLIQPLRFGRFNAMHEADGSKCQNVSKQTTPHDTLTSKPGSLSTSLKSLLMVVIKLLK